MPGHGRICDESEVMEYRDMLTIARDRIKALVDKGMTLQQVRLPADLEYDPEYGASDAFVEAVFRGCRRGDLRNQRARCGAGRRHRDGFALVAAATTPVAHNEAAVRGPVGTSVYAAAVGTGGPHGLSVTVSQKTGATHPKRKRVSQELTLDLCRC